jgi:hypothetical protein
VKRTNGVFCDVCLKPLPRGKAHTCEVCNWHACTPCENKIPFDTIEEKVTGPTRRHVHGKGSDKQLERATTASSSRYGRSSSSFNEGALAADNDEDLVDEISWFWLGSGFLISVAKLVLSALYTYNGLDIFHAALNMIVVLSCVPPPPPLTLCAPTLTLHPS